ncbi:hypothetical protein ACFV4M_02005 [Kitasatospora indigofera]|uniref:hypothetical protein n=1 Tax=Kitasatospora indigofera TaxID=67307 RepID=UPI003662D0D1
MTSNWREERRQDRLDAAEQAREDKRLDTELKLQAEADRAERQRQADADRAEQLRKDKREAEARAKRERAERAQRRGAQIAAARGWLAAEADTAFSVALILLSVIPAIASQVGALTGKTDPGSATALALMLELGAWSATVGASRAMKDGRPVGPYRVAMWACAAIAAGINVSHNGGFTDWFGLVMGAASMAGVAFWELRCVGRHGQSRRTKEERAEEKARRRHAKERKAKHPEVWKTSVLILADAEYKALSPEAAWTMAREIHRGTTEAGLTPELVTLRAHSKARMAEALGLDADAEPLFPDTVPQALLEEFGNTPGSVYRSPLGGPQDGDDDAGGTVLPRPSDGPSQGPTAHGRKGKRLVPNIRRKTPERPLDPGHVKQIRTLAEALGGKDKLSARNVREAIGGGSMEYAIRLRDAVKNDSAE